MGVEVDWLDSPEWADIIPQASKEDKNTACHVKYSIDFEKIMSFFKSVIEREEKSERCLKLTELVIEENPASYSAWFYRRQCLKEVEYDLDKELIFTTEKALETPKNYQVWYHRRILLRLMKKADKEKVFMDTIFKTDAKNYHAWAYRQWYVNEFDLFEDELSFVEGLIGKDMRNNSAWNHRFFVVFREWDSFTDQEKQMVAEAEARYCLECLDKVKNNDAVYNYLVGVSFKFGNGFFRPMETVDFKVEQIIKEVLDPKKNSFALLNLVVLLREARGDLGGVLECLQELRERDNVRKLFWEEKTRDVQEMINK